MPRSLIPAAAAVAAIALLPATADAAPSACSAGLPGPDGTTWQIAKDGALSSGLLHDGVRAWDGGHGRVALDGVVYAPVDGVSCERTGNTLTYPEQSVGALRISREVSVVGGRLRHVDAVRNTGGQAFPALRFRLERQDAQQASTSENGGTTIDDNDSWGVLNNAGKVFPLIQWGDHGAEQGIEKPEVLADGATFWEPIGLDAPESAELDYSQLEIGAGQTIRFLHVTAAGLGSQGAAVAQAQDDAAVFAGLPKLAPINWSADVDADGVTASADECPQTKGDLANGCKALVGNPVDPDVPAPAPAPQPAPAPAPAPIPTPATGSADRTGPAVTVTRLGRTVTRRRLAGVGILPSLRCSEACTLRVDVLRGKPVIFRAERKAFSTTSRAVRVRIRRARLTRSRLTIRIVATDRAGNRTTVRRALTLR